MNRRRFVRRAAAAGLAAPLLGAGAASARTASAAGLPEAVGSEAGATVYDGPLRGVAPITVTGVRADDVGAARITKVETSAGVVGWGEADRAGAGPAIVSSIIESFEARVVGRELFDAERTFTDLYFNADDMGRGGLVTSAISGIDLALWDARGKVLGRPCYQLIGGAYRTRIPVYGSFSRDGGDRTPADMARIAAAFVEQGFLAVKARMDIRQYNVDPVDDPTFEVVAAIRSEIGMEFPLYVDANNGYSASRAIEVGARLRDEFNVSVFEEPVGYTNYEDHAEVADALDGIQIAAGEHEYTRWQFRDLILRGRPDVVNPDLLRAGGLTEGRHIAALCSAFDLPIAVHSTRPTLGTAAHLHYVASLLRADRPQEHPELDKAESLWDLFENRTAYADGHVAVPEAPGLGLIVREGAIEAAARAYADRRR
ncbi:MAG: mandelate racemase/muconate lactonizing enzyme family protein [Bacteroidota bacterium]